ncbi:tail sheath protein [uncultured Caudovirales phage]|uniref:Tail sheath protein n=1 Tax=uncultured Caudovirales phage TaxID=2100421 RepID=A0A6J5LKF5_9CAUD|nr:tail sheath protein [uncultured Caudovirales phage]
MAFQISPGVGVSEVDLTTVVPSVLTTAGAFAGPFIWGPVNKRIQITSEIDLVNRFGNPDSNTYTSFFTAASFLAYGNNLNVVRVVGPLAKNATANTQASVAINNKDAFEYTYLNGNNNNKYGAFVARYPGALGNSLTVSVIDAGAAASFASWNINGISVSSYFTSAPNTSTQVANAGGLYDQMHVIVMDTGGAISGTKNTVLEVFPFLSKATDADDSLGNSNYYKNYIFNNSKYIQAIDPVSYATTSTTWGTPMAGTTYVTVTSPTTLALVNGADDKPTEANTQSGFAYFASSDEVDVQLVLTGDVSANVQQYVIDNVANARKDCIAFISPPSSAVINQAGSEVSNIVAWNTSLSRSTSYAFADSGWKYMFDKYNNTYRFVPLNGDTAGLCVYTDSIRDAWWSPAGFNRGQLKNVVRLAWNPSKAQRDSIYAIGVNPVCTFPGNGVILYGDKTLQTLPSAFDRINVRRLFIVLEKAISLASKYSLFEFNDEFTRAQFVALVTPFLRDIQGRRGIYDFRVVCDETNNTPNVIDSNQFVGDIYVKPARSINFIQLNFVAVRTGVNFSEVVGQF